MKELYYWMRFKELDVPAAADRFKIPYHCFYKYLYEGKIPRQPNMIKIFIGTDGVVDANDFNGTTRKVLIQKLLEQKGLRLEE